MSFQDWKKSKELADESQRLIAQFDEQRRRILDKQPLDSPRLSLEIASPRPTSSFQSTKPRVSGLFALQLQPTSFLMS